MGVLSFCLVGFGCSKKSDEPALKPAAREAVTPGPDKKTHPPNAASSPTKSSLPDAGAPSPSSPPKTPTPAVKRPQIITGPPLVLAYLDTVKVVENVSWPALAATKAGVVWEALDPERPDARRYGPPPFVRFEVWDGTRIRTVIPDQALYPGGGDPELSASGKYVLAILSESPLLAALKARVYAVDMETGATKMISSDEVSVFAGDGEAVYWADVEGKIYGRYMKGGSEVFLGKARGPNALTVYAGELFFRAGRGAEQGLFRVDLEGKKIERMPVPVGPKRVEAIRVADGALYWLAGGRLHMFDVAGGARQVRSFEARCPNDALAVHGRTAFCGGRRNVIAVDTKTGETSQYGDVVGDRAVAIEARPGELLWTIYDDRSGVAAVRRAELK